MDTKGTAVSPAGSVGASKCHRHFEVATGDPHPLAVVSKGGGAALAGGIQRRAEPFWQEESNEIGGFVAHDFVRKVVCVIPLATVGGGKGLFRAVTNAFSRPQNRRVLRPPGREAQDFAQAESACSGVGGAAKWRGEAQRSLAMERHHRGSKRDIKPAAASLLLK